jgi:hypothetical protein
MACAFNPSTWEVQEKDCKFKASLGYIVKFQTDMEKISK